MAASPRMSFPDSPNPFARTVGNFCGLPARSRMRSCGTGLVQERTGTALDIFGEHSVTGGLFGGGNRKMIDDYVNRCHEHIDIRIRALTEQFGRVPVNARLAQESGIAMIGCDCGANGSDMDSTSSR